MRLLRTISTPWTPYSVMFSRDGTRLAIGGGVFYGNGGILMVDLSSETTELFRCDRLSHADDDAVPAVSGLCFSDDDRHLAASSWRGRHHHAPTVLFEVATLNLTQRHTLPDLARGFACPTGVLLFDRYVITRSHRASADETLVVSECPADLRIRAGNTAHHLSSSHLAVVRNHAITAGQGLRLAFRSSYEQQWQALVDFRESGRAVAEGLVSIALDDETRTPQLIAVQGSREVTAIAATPDGEGFLTGGLEGELDHWLWNGHWRQQRLRDWTWDSPRVKGICYMCDGRHWVSVSSNGQLDLMNHHSREASWQLPTPGSPRALAAHPTQDWIAIGIKQSGWRDPRGAVDVLEVSPRVPAA